MKELSDLELLRIAFGKRAAARLIMLIDTDLCQLFHLSITELCDLPGVGPTKAKMLTALVELSRRSLGRKLPNRFTVGSPVDLYEWAQRHLLGLEEEHFLVVFLAANHDISGYKIVAKGHATGVYVTPSAVFRAAMAAHVQCVLLLHNHPSGSSEPSEEDKALTQRLVLAGDLIGIRVLDHLIIGRGEFYSFSAAAETEGKEFGQKYYK